MRITARTAGHRPVLERQIEASEITTRGLEKVKEKVKSRAGPAPAG